MPNLVEVNYGRTGKSTVASLSEYIQHRQPGLRGYSPQNLWRMRQFFETYREQANLSTLLREIPWSAHLHILSGNTESTFGCGLRSKGCRFLAGASFGGYRKHFRFAQVEGRTHPHSSRAQLATWHSGLRPPLRWRGFLPRVGNVQK